MSGLPKAPEWVFCSVSPPYRWGESRKIGGDPTMDGGVKAVEYVRADLYDGACKHGAAEERARIVAFLRNLPRPHAVDPIEARYAADAIEEGKHLP